ncbi:phage terminase small subunit [Paenibacillus sp. L3-i20]|uniref:phage terminase small subunit n=1 Tax=Paenibacillus sp. L3-i20 TaxID=2905833 RepID=UPI001EE062C8|nr:phage terminase small subunit [Paenibacillus sp. L3-i20]GKU79872.1 hypothetical protein L3i20_v242690 [Paenibacillus sp. L3-i20]
MARERSPDRMKAMQMWLDSNGDMKLKDIAATLALGETQIRKWKSLDKWDDVLKGNVTIDDKGNVTKRKGAPKGNKNAVGNNGGAPKGNKNAIGNSGGTGGPFGNKKAVRTGEFESIWVDTLDDLERELVDGISTDPVQQTDESIRLLTIRERRMLQRINRLTEGLTESERRVLQQLRTKKEAYPVHDERTGLTKTVATTKEELVTVEVAETTFRAVDDILRIEEALTRVQAQKIRAIDLKNKLIDKEKELRIEKLKHELQILKGENDGEDAHEASKRYEATLDARAEDVFADDEVIDDEA